MIDKYSALYQPFSPAVHLLPGTRLVTEIDGELHDIHAQFVKNKERAKIAESMGLQELCYKNEEVLFYLDEILLKITEKLNQST